MSSGENRRRGLRRGGGARCSHSTRLDVPVLDLGSKMTSQLAHEGNGILLQRAQSSAPDQRHRILHALSCNGVDLSKVQMCGHCDQLTVRLIESLLQYLLTRKGQVPESISWLRKRKGKGSSKATSASGRRSNADSTRARKEDKLLRKLAQLGHHLDAAVKQLNDNSGEGPSSRPHATAPPSLASQNIRLLIVMGTSASMPREVLVLDLVQAVGRASDTGSHLLDVINAGRVDELETASSAEDMEQRLADLLSQASDQQRDAARDKTSLVWGRKLVCLVMENERLESFFGTPLAPTKTHVFLSGPNSFRCPGWLPRHHLDFNLDHLCETSTTDPLGPASGSTDTSISSLIADGAGADRKRALSSPVQDEHRPWIKSPRDSSSSVAESWPEDSASEQLWESSISSLSEDSRPASVADKRWPVEKDIVSEEWLSVCSSPSVSGSCSPSQALHSIQASRTGSSLGSSTVYGHDTNDTAMDISLDVLSVPTEGSAMRIDGESPMDDSASRLSVASARTDDGERVGRRRSREPKAGGLLSRNLLKPRQSRQNSYAASDSSSVRSVASSLKRAPRCAGLQINFTDPHSSATVEQAAEERTSHHCWFQCEVVLEGYR